MIIDAINTYSVVSNSVPGSGKTTVALAIAVHYQRAVHKEILCITYSTALKDELRMHKHSNMEVHSYHSLCKKYYNNSCINDEYLIKVLDNNSNPIAYDKCKQFDIIIIDEVQDMTLEYYKLVNKFINDHSLMPKLLIIGDEDQCIYEFKGADRRYLCKATEVFGKYGPFVEIPLTVSYRLPLNISNYVNCVIGVQKISSFEGIQTNGWVDVVKPTGNHQSDTDLLKNMASWIVSCVKTSTYKPSDFYILSYSIKKELSLVSRFEKVLTQCNMKSYNNEGELTLGIQTIDDSVGKYGDFDSKVNIRTMHSSKGMERKVVIVFMDGCKLSNGRIPPEVYVSMTRAKERLVLVGDIMESAPLVRVNYGVKDVIKYLPSTCLNVLNDELRKLVVNTTSKAANVNISNSTEGVVKREGIESSEYLSEDVSDINGIAIPYYYYLLINSSTGKNKKAVDHYTKKLTKKELSVRNSLPTLLSQCLYTADVIISKSPCRKYNIKQKNGKYDWLDNSDIRSVESIILPYIHDKVKYDKTVKASIVVNDTEFNITGIIDAYDKASKTIVEFKCKKILSIEDQLQCMLYAYLLSNTSDTKSVYYPQRCILISLLTGEKITYNIHENRQVINTIIGIILSSKLRRCKYDDNTFIELHYQLSDTFNGMYRNNQICDVGYPVDTDISTGNVGMSEIDVGIDVGMSEIDVGNNAAVNRHILVVDIETNGLSIDDLILEIGIILVNDSYEIIYKYSSLISYNGEIPKINAHSSKIHGITESVYKSEGYTNIDTIIDMLSDIITKYDNPSIMGHNVQFDIKRLDNAAKKIRNIGLFDKCDVICTLSIARSLKMKNKKLVDLYEDLKSSYSKGGCLSGCSSGESRAINGESECVINDLSVVAHRALYDAYMSLMCYIMMKKMYTSCNN